MDDGRREPGPGRAVGRSVVPLRSSRPKAGNADIAGALERDGHQDQCTMVTEYSGALAGQRVVRGRDGESGFAKE